MRIFRIFLDIPLNHAFRPKILNLIENISIIKITTNPNQAHFIVQIEDTAISIKMVPESKLILLGDYSKRKMVPPKAILMNYKSGNAWHPEIGKWIYWRTLLSEYL